MTAAQSVILRQNAARPAPVPRSVIDRLADRLEPPTALEAHAVAMGVFGG